MAKITRLRLQDYSDRELIMLVEDLLTKRGDWPTSEDIAKAIGISSNHGIQCVSARMSALSRMDVFHNTAMNGQLAKWEITDYARVFILSDESRKRASGIIDETDDEDLLVVLHELGKRTHKINRAGRHLLRREFKREIES